MSYIFGNHCYWSHITMILQNLRQFCIIMGWLIHLFFMHFPTLIFTKIVCFAHKILVFHFFSLFSFAHGSVWRHLQCDRYNLNVKFLIFFKNFTRSIVLKFGVKTPINKNNSSSLIFTNLELKFEACMLNLIWKWGAKDPKKREDYLIFINFGIKKFTLKNTPKKQNFDVWML
jgi:hypothetical protein